MAGEALSRPDGRAGNQIRPLVCTRSLLSRADGSAQWSQVLAAVYGPKSVTGKKENPEYASLEVIWKPKSGLSGKFEKEAELIVKRSLESIILAALYPNLGISIILQVINDDGSLLACAMNAACAALVDAGIPLTGLIAAVSCGVTVNNEVILDLLKSEEQKNVAHVCLVFPSQPVSVVLELPSNVDEKPEKQGFITCVMRGAMDGPRVHFEIRLQLTPVSALAHVASIKYPSSWFCSLHLWSW
ncbi:hypothetical protein CY35_12G033400 [Sphagnum magellanicum]|nr:hypothetical protein CY35_12G033400 [Sphagnum magellanicum]KAH9545148.1 hypothetical protein CY35_12G033400 [Sphagnum magellanicum]